MSRQRHRGHIVLQSARRIVYGTTDGTAPCMNAVTAHELPCRIRYVVKALRHDGAQAVLLRDRMAALPGIVAVEASPLTGSLTIAHDGRPATRERIAACLAQAGCAVQAAPRPGAAQAGSGEAGLHLLLRIAAQTLAEHALRATLIAVI